MTNSRRDLLKLSSLGLAATAFPALASAEPAVKPVALLADVRTYGAAGDGKTLDTPAINRAIDAVAAAGGGVVYFPAGTYVCFSIHLRSNVELYLSRGCTIVAADSPLPGQTTGYSGGTYDAAEPNPFEAFQDYGHNHWHNSLFWGENLHDVSITGPGLINGKGLSVGRTHDLAGFLFIAEQPGVGNKSIAMKNCRNVIFRDFSILNGGHFGFLLTGVDNVTLDNITLDTNRDGIDIDCCRNVRVSNCTVNSPWDDAIVPKSSFALGELRPTENVTITDCLVTGYYQLGSVIDGTFKKYDPSIKLPRMGRIKFGTESNGAFRNVAISSCVFEGCQGLTIGSADGALVEDISVSNITMRDIVVCPIFIRLNSRLRGPKDTTKVGNMRRIIIDNLVSYNSAAASSSSITGIPGYNVEDVKLSNIYIQHVGGGTAEQAAVKPKEGETHPPETHTYPVTPSHGFYLRHVKNIEMSHVEIQPMSADARPAFVLDSVDRADFIAVTTPTTPPAFHLTNVTDLRILISRAAKDTVLAAVTDQIL